ncbi:hypothetical protein MesoLj113b_09910 [Mesorhizobium sp. 113-3-3]|nr:hypothetical protein MesoLj113b_09910 [Mesorhizobium sp. 113-3-3]
MIIAAMGVRSRSRRGFTWQKNAVAGIGARNEARGFAGVFSTSDNRPGKIEGWPQRIVAARDEHNPCRDSLDGNGGAVRLLFEACQAVFEKPL